MVYTERTDKCLTKAKDNADQSKARSQSQKTSQGGSSSGAWSSQASNADKWKYNNMVKDNREQFNAMHHC